jgi:hypothetical protein
MSVALSLVCLLVILLFRLDSSGQIKLGKKSQIF